MVVGAGPAGAAAALEARRLRPEASVLRVDKAEFPRDKACGDGLGQHAVDELEALGAAGVLEGYPPIRGLRLRSPRGLEVAGDPARPNYVIPRSVLDVRLVEAATAAGAQLRRASVRHLDQHDGLVTVDGELAAPVVVGADGANSTVRRLLGAPSNPDRALAIAVRGYAPAPAGRRPERREWQVVGAQAGRVGVGLGKQVVQAPVELGPVAVEAAAQQPVADVGQPGPGRERPDIGRPALGHPGDQLLGAARRGGRVAADGDGQRPVRVGGDPE